MIEEWMTNETLSKSCFNISDLPHNELLWDSNVVPYLKTTVKGWLWLQGENNMHAVKGNSLYHIGYG